MDNHRDPFKGMVNDGEDDGAAAQLAHDVVTTLGFGCFLVATSDSVVTTLSQRCISVVVTTTKN